MPDETKSIAETIGAGVEVMPTFDMKAKLRELGISDNAVIEKVTAELGAVTLEDLMSLKEADLTGIGMKPIPARRVIASLTALKPAEATPVASAPSAVSVSFDSMLPAVPSDSSWLEALRAGGILKVGQSTVISAIRAALAHKAGLFGIPETLAELMEKFADSIQEQVDPEYFAVRKEMTRRSYAEIFEAIPGLDGSYVTEARKKRLFARIDEHLWPAIIEFYRQIESWQKTWLQGAANPNVMMASIAQMAGGGVSILPPGMLQAPDTGILHDTASALADAINKVFAGTGAQIASAMAYDASKIKDTLENTRLPALIGAANRDQMLRQLGVAVSATYPRMELNLTRFVLSVMQLKDQPAGNEELQYLSALVMLGSQIPWDQLSGNSSVRPTGVGGGALRDGSPRRL